MSDDWDWGHEDCSACDEARDSGRDLLIKYIAHVAVAEGESFALDVHLSPAGMGKLEFTDEQIRELEHEIFPEVKKRLKE